ncbi:MAG: deoxyguanosinetriphosphate triphosphohydrolase [Acidiferrobacterales bacterium]|nr:deoxyguanosinetriphosphate triphosphohydrolase [Acidiferrobacterales bacterium]
MSQPAMSGGLAAYAVSEANTRGRRYAETAPAYRGEFQRDRDRIIHCAAFRRLEYKTQVFVNHEGDLFRTRLTHSLEVAQIGRSVARALRLNEDLTEAISLAHDLGHTPFGHTGQHALNECMREYGGFEHNLQSLRVVDVLEERYAEFPGLNLTFETREGILKHCSREKAKELGDLGKRFLENQQPSLEAQLANIADEIAYNNHDVDDGLRYGLIGIEQLMEVELFAREYAALERRYPDLTMRRRVHETVRHMINRVVVDLIEHTAQSLAAAQVQSVDDVRQAGQPLFSYSEGVAAEVLGLKRFLRENLYSHYRVRRMSRKAAGLIKELFDAFMEDPRLLPPQYQGKLPERRSAPAGCARVIADYIAGMTDRYAIQEHARLFNPAELTWGR